MRQLLIKKSKKKKLAEHENTDGMPWQYLPLPDGGRHYAGKD
jgi:hypothetical protein